MIILLKWIWIVRLHYISQYLLSKLHFIPPDSDCFSRLYSHYWFRQYSPHILYIENIISCILYRDPERIPKHWVPYFPCREFLVGQCIFQIASGLINGIWASIGRVSHAWLPWHPCIATLRHRYPWFMGNIRTSRADKKWRPPKLIIRK